MAFLRVWLYLWFPKGYPSLLSMPTWGPWVSVQRLALQMATAVTMGVDMLDISQPQLRLSILLFSTWAASSALWQAALACWMASLCGSSLLLDLD